MGIKLRLVQWLLKLLEPLLRKLSPAELAEIYETPELQELRGILGNRLLALSMNEIPEEVKEHFFRKTGKKEIAGQLWLSGRVYRVPMIIEPNDPNPEEGFIYCLLEYCNTLYSVRYFPERPEGKRMKEFWHET